MMQFIDLAAQQSKIRDRIDARIASVLDHGSYIMGPEVREFEAALADFCGAKHCLSCANGTDALQLALMALGIGPSDHVIVPSFTFAASAEAVCLVGAEPAFADIDPDSYNMDAASLERVISEIRAKGGQPKAVMTVDLFGLPADYPTISAICDREGLALICDSAQGFGGLIDGQMTGTFGTITTTSFFPAKPLGCYGDGGALFTNDPALAGLIDSLRVHGKGTEKYDNVRIGMNSRLDTLQAAILLEKLAIYAEETALRQDVAKRYDAALHNRFVTPRVPEGYQSVWAQYTLRAVSADERQAAMAALKAEGIPSVVYYPRPLHTQSIYASFLCDPQGLAASETCAETVFSLPMHPYLSPEDQERVISVLNGMEARA
ncbi:MAG: DegT/DnrJ/EryC1/StrS family aminotransferase [Paracoccaceae bacterium]